LLVVLTVPVSAHRIPAVGPRLGFVPAAVLGVGVLAADDVVGPGAVPPS
jgi:hypothetical protein